MKSTLNIYRASILVLVFATLVGVAKADPPMTPAAAAALGSASGNTPTTFAGVSTSGATANVSGYTTAAPPEAGYFNGGTGDTVTPGNIKMSGCVSGPVTGIPSVDQECNAIKSLQGAPAITPSLGITRSDPLLTTGKSITTSPTGFANDDGAGYAGCTATSTTVPGTSVDQVCHDYFTIGTNQCVINRVIVVAVDTTYQCVKQDKSIKPQTCHRTMSATMRYAVDYYMLSACAFGYQVVCDRRFNGPWVAALLNTAWAAGGRPNLMLNGVFVSKITTPFIGGNGSGNLVYASCDYTNIMLNAVSCTYGRAGWSCASHGWNGSLGRGNVLSMCGDQSCTGLTRVCVDSGCNWACTGNGVGSTCPSGYTLMTDAYGVKFCRENLYNTNSADPTCTYLGSAATTVPGTKSATQHKWACRTQVDGCTVQEAASL